MKFIKLIRRVRGAALIGTASAVTACASGGTANERERSAESLHHDRSTILAADIRDLNGVTNLYEVVQRLHPEWLNPRNSSSIGRRSGITNEASNDIQVYLEVQRAGNTDILKSMALGSAVALRYFSAPEAQARFGPGNLNGVIQVLMVK